MSTPEPESHLNIVCALACEAKPLIDSLQLRKIDRTPYSRFCGDIDGRPVNLLVSGIGAKNMVSAVNWLQECLTGSKNVWLNMGVSGHADLDLGNLVLVHCVSEVEADRRHYPPLVVPFDGLDRRLISYDKPCMDYPHSALVDMEGAAFFSSALNFCSAELVQALKVVSDNKSVGPEDLTAQAISDLILPHMATIKQFAIDLFDLMPEPFLISTNPGWSDNLHLSVSHRYQIEQLHQKLLALNAVDTELHCKLKKSTSANQVLSILRDRLNSLTPVLP